jgi:glyoxylase-like metal-dependent hydrolase (beta-lactamase superfamily II)
VRTAQEYALLDRAGRMQLPADFVSTLDLRERVRLSLEPDHVRVAPGHDRRARDGDADGPVERSGDQTEETP